MKDSISTSMTGAVTRMIGKQVYFAVYYLTGIRLAADTYYADWGQISAIFLAPIEKIAPLLPSKKLQLIEHSPGKTGVYIAGNNFRKIRSLPPYNEFVVAVPVTYNGPGAAEDITHYYFLTLPVSKEAARWGGAHLMGMPKFVAPITYEEGERAICCTVCMEGQDFMSLEMERLETSFQTLERAYYGFREGKYIRTRVHVEGMRGTREGPPGARFRLGTHPMADRFIALEIEKVSISSFYMSRGSSVLYKPDLILPA
jgi:hypothetical protein